MTIVEHAAAGVATTAGTAARGVRGGPGEEADAATAPGATNGASPAEHELPWIISVDDHILEPRDLWQRELPLSWRDRGPRVSREKARLDFHGGKLSLQRGVDDGHWCDIWLFDDLVAPTGLLHAAGGIPPEQQENVPAIYEDFRPGTYDQAERLADMDRNHVQAAINYPNTFPRFCGQGFLEREDKALALACLQIYNDWMIDEWGGGAGRGRLIPLTLVPLWDAELAAAEVYRCAAKGTASIAFSENPFRLGLPSLYTGFWDPLWRACTETNTTVSMHIGSSSSMPTTCDDAPLAVSMSLNCQNAQGSVVDWVYSRRLEMFPDLKLAYAESQVGWMPFQWERMDSVWHEDVGGVRLPEPPSSYVKGRIYGCIFDDLHGLRSRDEVGMDQILFECDFPHPNGSFPNSRAVAHRLIAAAGRRGGELQAAARQRDPRVRARPLRDRRVTSTADASTAASVTSGAGTPSTGAPGAGTGRAGFEPDLDTGEPGLVAKVVRLNILVTKALEDVTGRAGVSLADYLVLGVVRRSPGGRTTPTRICEVLRRTSGGMTLTLDRLEQAGWLRRSADPTDRRRVVVQLTDAGRELAIRVNDDMHAWEERLALPVRSRERIDAELDALLAVFE